MKKLFLFFCICVAFYGCKQSTPTSTSKANTDSIFHHFEERFMDAYWKQFPSAAINAGYFNYAGELKIPDQNSFTGDDNFAKHYLDSLQTFSFDELNANSKIDFLILQNQLEGSLWYADTFKQQEWDPSLYNIGSDCYEIINKNFAPLDQRLKVLSNHFEILIRTIKQHSQIFTSRHVSTLILL